MPETSQTALVIQIRQLWVLARARHERQRRPCSAAATQRTIDTVPLGSDQEAYPADQRCNDPGDLILRANGSAALAAAQSPCAYP